FFFSSGRRHTRWPRDWSSDVCSSDLRAHPPAGQLLLNDAPVDTEVEELGRQTGAVAKLLPRSGGGVLGLAQDAARHRARLDHRQIGRASCRERGWVAGCDVESEGDGE